VSVHDELKQIEHDKYRVVALYTSKGLFYGPLVNCPSGLWSVKDTIASIKADFEITFKESAVKHIYFPRRLIVIGD